MCEKCDMCLDNSHQQHLPSMFCFLLCRCCSYCAPALACSAYGLAVLKFRPPRAWTQTLLFETQRQMPAFGAQELCNLLWALAVLGLRPGADWFRDFEVQVCFTGLTGGAKD